MWKGSQSIRLSRDTELCHDHRLEEAETNLVAKQEANALLNSQVDLLAKQLQELQAGKAAYEKHVKDLSALLAKERRQHAADPTQVLLKSACHHRVSTHLNVHCCRESKMVRSSQTLQLTVLQS